MSVTRIADGRRKRGDQSRRQIVDAMIDLVRSGEMSPSAAQVAERAGVGLRTVFRHFDEMEVLYREMAEVIRARIMPLKVAGSVLRFRSPFLMEDYHEHLRMERKTLRQVLPDFILEDGDLFRALEMLTSFQAWRRLRQDQGLSAIDAKRVTLRLIEGALKS
jgi:AcrR family transcriptional regulator